MDEYVENLCSRADNGSKKFKKETGKDLRFAPHFKYLNCLQDYREEVKKYLTKEQSWKILRELKVADLAGFSFNIEDLKFHYYRYYKEQSPIYLEEVRQSELEPRRHEK